MRPAELAVADRFERIMGSKLVAMFAPALFDEMMHPAVSASLVDTDRIRDDPFNRARRTAASDQLAFFAHKADRQDEMERLVRLHRDLTGVQPDGKRYSALSPEPWNWNLISIFFMHRGVFIAVGGEHLSPADDQAIWDRFRHMCDGLQMPGRARQLTERYEDLCAYYDQMVDETLTHTESLDIVIDATLRPKRPDYVPSIFQPLWTLIAPASGIWSQCSDSASCIRRCARSCPFPGLAATTSSSPSRQGCCASPIAGCRHGSCTHRWRATSGSTTVSSRITRDSA